MGRREWQAVREEVLARWPRRVVRRAQARWPRRLKREMAEVADRFHGPPAVPYNCYG